MVCPGPGCPVQAGRPSGRGRRHKACARQLALRMLTTPPHWTCPQVRRVQHLQSCQTILAWPRARVSWLCAGVCSSPVMKAMGTTSTAPVKVLQRHVQALPNSQVSFFRPMSHSVSFILYSVPETSILHCFAGGAGIPLHWSLQADTRNVCLRFAPDSPGDAGPQWSHPLELEKSLSSTARYISLPVRPAAASPGTQAVRRHMLLAEPIACNLCWSTSSRFLQHRVREDLHRFI